MNAPIFISLLLLFSAPDVRAQGKVALLDKKAKQPILFTDSITVEQVSNGLVPIRVADFDTLNANIEFLIKMLEKRQRSKMQSFELRSGDTKFFIERIPFAYGDRYSIKLTSFINEIKAGFSFSDGNRMNNDVAKSLRNFKEYIEKNKLLFRSPNSITPKVYNVYVIKE